MHNELGTRLLDAGLVTGKQLKSAQQSLLTSGGHPERGGDLAAALKNQGLHEDALVGFFLSDGFVLCNDEQLIPSEHILGKIGIDLARVMHALPLRVDNELLIVAMADPTDQHAISELRFAAGLDVAPMAVRIGALFSALQNASKETLLPAASAEMPEPAALRKQADEADEVASPPEGPPEQDSDDQSASMKRFRPPKHSQMPEPLSLPPAPATEVRIESTDSFVPLGDGMREAAEQFTNEIDASVAKEVDAWTPAAVVTPKPLSSPPDVGNVFASIRNATDRDAVVGFGCAAAASVCDAVVFLALRKGVLRGWDARGTNISHDAIRNLWLPASSPSVFRGVIRSGVPYAGEFGSSAADSLFRAAIGTQNNYLIVQPIKVAGKTVAMLCADGVLFDTDGERRVEETAQAIASAFERIILSKKRGS